MALKIEETQLFKEIASFYKGYQKTLLSLSGGPDSLALFHLLLKLKELRPDFSFEVFLLNHLIKGNEKFATESFHYVVDLCKTHEIICHAYYVEIQKIKLTKAISDEEAGREVRHSYVKDILEKRNLESVSMAHHLDDHIETTLINLFQGSGVKGFLGIQPKNENILRPLLPFQKKELIEFLEEFKLPYFLDPTNFENDYLRNKVRNILIPEIASLFPQYHKKILQLQEIVSEQNIYLNKKLPVWKTNFYSSSLKLEKLKSQDSLLMKETFLKGLRELTKNYYVSYKHFKEIQNRLDKLTLPLAGYKILYAKKGFSLVVSYEDIIWLYEEKLLEYYDNIKNVSGIQVGDKNILDKDGSFKVVLKSNYELKKIDKEDILFFEPKRRVKRFFQERKIHYFERPFFKGIFFHDHLIGVIHMLTCESFIHKDHSPLQEKKDTES